MKLMSFMTQEKPFIYDEERKKKGTFYISSRKKKKKSLVIEKRSVKHCAKFCTSPRNQNEKYQLNI